MNLKKQLFSMAVGCCLLLSACTSNSAAVNTSSALEESDSQTAIEEGTAPLKKEIAPSEEVALPEEETITESLNYTPIIDLPEKNQDFTAFANLLLEQSMSMPEVLASTISGFPTVATTIFGSDDPLEIEQILETSGKGGELQKRAVGAIAAILMNESTVYRPFSYTNQVQMLGMDTSNRIHELDDPEFGIHDVQLVWYTQDLQEHPSCMAVSATIIISEDEATGAETTIVEEAYFWPHGGMQRFVP